MENWTFDQSPKTAAITTRQVIDDELPILCVLHYKDDHSWAFLCGTTNNSEDGRLISMEEALKIDPSLLKISHLPPGYKATRNAIDSEWVVTRS